jgi:two-component system, chemotaxis family, CheB/CheR fusion protein
VSRPEEGERSSLEPSSSALRPVAWKRSPGSSTTCPLIYLPPSSWFSTWHLWAQVSSRSDEIVPRLIEAKGPRDPIRIWSTGCASGEEAYTLAIIFAEKLGEAAFLARVKIYATDVDAEALSQGRHGLYTSKEAEPVPPDLRARYFDQVDSHFAFRRELRRAIIFGRHNLLEDPPISRIDLLSAR